MDMSRWNVSVYLLLASSRFSGKKSKCEWRKYVFSDILQRTALSSEVIPQKILIVVRFVISNKVQDCFLKWQPRCCLLLSSVTSNTRSFINVRVWGATNIPSFILVSLLHKNLFLETYRFLSVSLTELLSIPVLSLGGAGRLCRDPPGADWHFYEMFYWWPFFFYIRFSSVCNFTLTPEIWKFGIS